MSNDKMREEFEAAYLKDVSERFKGCEVGDEEWVERGPSGEYRSFRAAGAWWAWQASREALVIEWPDQHTYTVPDCAGAAILDCRTAFSKAVKVKP